MLYCKQQFDLLNTVNYNNIKIIIFKLCFLRIPTNFVKEIELKYGRSNIKYYFLTFGNTEK